MRKIMQIYHFPQYYSIEERLEIIKKHLNQGDSFFTIGMLFGVEEGTIKYHYERYELKTWKPPNKPKEPTKDVYREYIRELCKAGLC